MDIFAHTLWAAAIAKRANKNKKLIEKNKKILNPWWAGFWGVIPDFFAFGFPFLAVIFFIITGQLDFSFFGSHHGFGFPESARWIGELPHYLYQISHSLVIFSSIFLIIWIIRKRPYYEMLGWLLHILIDIPSHSATFYPTPFLWPISDFKFLHGVSWSNPTYMIVNYILLGIVWTIILVNYFRKKKKLAVKSF